MGSDDREAWKSWNEGRKSYYGHLQSSGVNWLVDWGIKNRAYVKVVTDYQVTVSKNGVKMNIYPTSKKYYNFNTKERGKYKNILHFLNGIYGKERVGKV